MNETANLNPYIARHWPKRLARRMGVPLSTARHWIENRMPPARRYEIAQALIAECNELEHMINETRRHWTEVAAEMARADERAVSHPGGPTDGRVRSG